MAVLFLLLCLSPNLQGWALYASRGGDEPIPAPLGSLAGKHMQIQFERSGGVTGIGLTVTIDTASLSAEEARELGGLVEAAGFFTLLLENASPAPGNDRFLYIVTVEMEGRRHTVRTGDGAVPTSLKPLIDWLHLAARKAQRRKGAR